MANLNTNKNSLLYFLVGAILVGMVGFGIYYFTQDHSAKADLEISIGDDGIRIDGK